MMALSLIGVSITRSQPNRSSNPSLVLNAPPYTPTSSPINRTAGSRSISSNMACRMASRKVICAPPVADPLLAPPFGPAMATSAPFAKHSLQQPLPSLGRSWPLALFPLLLGGRCLPDSQQQPSCRQNESAHQLHPTLCLSRSQEPSTPP